MDSGTVCDTLRPKAVYNHSESDIGADSPAMNHGASFTLILSEIGSTKQLVRQIRSQPQFGQYLNYEHVLRHIERPLQKELCRTLRPDFALLLSSSMVDCCLVWLGFDNARVPYDELKDGKNDYNNVHHRMRMGYCRTFPRFMCFNKDYSNSIRRKNSHRHHATEFVSLHNFRACGST
eukprot:scaffold14825_cov20-Cyclotella_meneghiniana.AAC.4